MQQFLSVASAPAGFYSQRFFFPVLEPWTAWSGLGLGSFVPKLSLLIFIHHKWMWDWLFHWRHSCLSMPYHLSALSPDFALPVCLNECSFFKSLVFGFPYSLVFWHIWMFFVLWSSCNFSVVVWRGEACLPMLPSWPEIQEWIIKFLNV